MSHQQQQARGLFAPSSGLNGELDWSPTDAQLKLLHDSFPRPVGKGRQANITALMTANPLLGATLFSVSGRIERGAIPFRLQDLRCSYCLVCHETTPLRCGQCRKVYYCNRDCQKKHWSYHKKVCGTVTETWDLEEWRDAYEVDDNVPPEEEEP